MKFLRYAVSLGAQFGGMVITLATQIVLARMMGPANYGRIGLITNAVLLFANLSTCGLTPLLPRYLAVYRGGKKFGSLQVILRWTAIYFLVAAIVLTAAIWGAAPLVARLMGAAGFETSFIAFGLFTPFILLFLWATSVLKGMGRNATENVLSTTVLAMVTLGLSVAMWVATKSVVWTLAAQGIAYIAVGAIALFIALGALRKTPTGDDRPDETFGRIISNGVPVGVTTMAAQIFRRGDSIIIAALLGEAALGIYRTAYTIASGIRNMLAPINDFSMVRISMSVGRGDSEGIWRGYEFAVGLALALSLPVFVMVAAFSREIITIAFGDVYRVAAPLLPILCAGFVFHVALGPMGSLFVAIGQNWMRMVLVLFVAAFNIAINIVFIKMWGINGTAIGTATTFLVLYVLLTLYLVITESRSGITRPIAIMTAAALFSGALLVVVPFGNVWIKLVLALAASGGIFIGGLRAAFRTVHPASGLRDLGREIASLLTDVLDARQRKRARRNAPPADEG